MLYLFSSIVTIVVFLFVKKVEKKQNIFGAVAMAIMAYICWLSLIAGIMGVLHISIDIYSVSIVNFFLVMGMVIYLYKKKEFQHYYIDILDAFFALALIVVTVIVFINRYSAELCIVFETSDPATHLKGAMNFVNEKTVSSLYLANLTNGLFIEGLQSIFSGAYIYKSFIIQCGINFLLAGAIFWAALQRFERNILMKILIYAATLAYMFGYPYNDMLFGFVYLQLTISVICYIVVVMQDYLDEKVNGWIYCGMLSIGCLGVGIGYTLFAPVVFLGILGCIVYKACRGGWIQGRKSLSISKKFICICLYIFLVPTILTLWYIVLNPSGKIDVGSSLNIEGYIYKNLYSDFLLFIIPAIYGLASSFKVRRINLLSVIMPVFGIYYLYFFYKMHANEVSTYYFYKLNFMLWLIVLYFFVVGMNEFLCKDKIMFCSCLITPLFLVGMHFSNVEWEWNGKNANLMPFIDAGCFFRIYSCNIAWQKGTPMPEGLVDISELTFKEYNDEDVLFIGYWIDLYWYEALSNQRISEEVTHSGYSYSELLERFVDGKYGNYAVVKKDTEGIEAYQQFLQEHIIYENEYAYMIGLK